MSIFRILLLNLAITYPLLGRGPVVRLGAGPSQTVRQPDRLFIKRIFAMLDLGDSPTRVSFPIELSNFSVSSREGSTVLLRFHVFYSPLEAIDKWRTHGTLTCFFWYILYDTATLRNYRPSQVNGMLSPLEHRPTCTVLLTDLLAHMDFPYQSTLWLPLFITMGTKACYTTSVTPLFAPTISDKYTCPFATTHQQPAHVRIFSCIGFYMPIGYSVT